MKNILIVGANGQIGRMLIKKLRGTEHTSVAMARKVEQVDELKALGATHVILGDLEKDFSHAFAGVDTVIFTAGSGGHTGGDKTILIDLWGAIKTIDEAEKLGVKRFIMVSSMNTETPESGPDSMRHYYVAKRLADDHLKRSNLNYTIARPGRLTNEPGTGKIIIEEKIESFESRDITREDVADVIIGVLDQKNTYKREFEVLNGESLILKRLKNFKMTFLHAQNAV